MLEHGIRKAMAQIQTIQVLVDSFKTLPGVVKKAQLQIRNLKYNGQILM